MPATVALLAILAAAPPASRPTKTAVLVESTAFGDEIATHWRSAFASSLAKGLEAGALRVVRPRDIDTVSTDACTTNVCSRDAARAAKTDFSLRSRVTVDDEDTLLNLTVVAARDGEQVASVERRCELCGPGEVVELVELEAARLRAQLEAYAAAPASVLLRTVPPGARVSIDGTPTGTTPIEREVTPGRHLVELRLDGYVPESLRIDAVRGVAVQRSIQLSRDRSHTQRRSRARIAGAVTLGVGLVGVVVGSVLVGIHGRPYRANCQADIGGTCRFTYDTLVGGGVALGTGLAGVVVGSALLGATRRRR